MAIDAPWQFLEGVQSFSFSLTVRDTLPENLMTLRLNLAAMVISVKS
jgi:hypothetical protein